MQGVIETSLAEILGHDVGIVGAGRTDAGVHASGQVLHFDSSWIGRTAELRRAANAVLPRDVAVLRLSEAPPGFHARYSATVRGYRYRLWCRPVRQPLVRRTSLHVPYPLDVEAMSAAASMLVGSHDFAALGRPMGGTTITVRRLDRLDVVARGGFVDVRFAGNAFLRHQVRRTVGLLLDIGRGKWPPEAVDAVLARREGAPLAWRAPAWGLMLTHVGYPSKAEFIARARERALMGGEER